LAAAVVVPDSEAVGDADRHVVVDDVGLLDQLARDVDALRVLEVERDVALAALATHERLVDEAHAVAGERLDLDDVGAEVADDHRAERPREVLAEVDEHDALERSRHQRDPVGGNWARWSGLCACQRAQKPMWLT
jgi:hypothetical protein